MKLLVYIVSMLVLLNVFVLWKLNEKSAVSESSSYSLEVTPQAKNAHLFQVAERVVNIAPLQRQIEQLNARLEAMELAYEERVAGRNEQDSNPLEHNVGMEGVVEPLNHASNSASSEEWFWTEDDGDELPLSFNETEGFTVNSVVCRSDWCRIELEDASGGSGDLISDLELQLKINESLGRDTVMMSGERNGSHRVLFIQ